MVSLANVLEWKYGFVASTEQVDKNDKSSNPKMRIKTWGHLTIAEPDELQLRQDAIEYQAYLDSIAYIELRRREYLPITDQLERIINSLRNQRSAGTTLDADAEYLVNEIDRIKIKYPKPEAS